ncbi:MAG: cupin-like domain-containing protein, partial [Noviherbaspirillum sp.]
MSREKNSVARNQEPPESRVSSRLPPRMPVSKSTTPEDAIAKKQARERKDAQIRGVTSIQEMREAIRLAGRDIPAISAVPRMGMLDAAAFRTLAAKGLPFVITGLVNQWPLSALTPQTLRDRFSDLRVRARVGDYVNTAFAPDRAMQDMSMLEYLELVSTGTQDLPPYLGNLELRELNRMCYW